MLDPDEMNADPQRESDTRFLTSGFFHESVSPRPPSIPLGPFRIFRKFAEILKKKIFTNEYLSQLSTTPAISGVNDTGKKLSRGNNQKALNCSPVSTTPPKNCSPVSTTPPINYSAVSTCDSRVLPILACLHLKIKNKQKFNL